MLRPTHMNLEMKVDIYWHADISLAGFIPRWWNLSVLGQTHGADAVSDSWVVSGNYKHITWLHFLNTVASAAQKMWFISFIRNRFWCTQYSDAFLSKPAVTGRDQSTQPPACNKQPQLPVTPPRVYEFKDDLTYLSSQHNLATTSNTSVLRAKPSFVAS